MTLDPLDDDARREKGDRAWHEWFHSPEDEHLNADENVKAMRETAQRIGLTRLLVRASHSNAAETQALLRRALCLLGEPS